MALLFMAIYHRTSRCRSKIWSFSTKSCANPSVSFFGWLSSSTFALCFSWVIWYPFIFTSKRKVCQLLSTSSWKKIGKGKAKLSSALWNKRIKVLTWLTSPSRSNYLLLRDLTNQKSKLNHLSSIRIPLANQTTSSGLKAWQVNL